MLIFADPAFVHAQLIPDSAERNDDKLYFFFREKSTDAPQSPVVYSRIGRICLVCVEKEWNCVSLGSPCTTLEPGLLCFE